MAKRKIIWVGITGGDKSGKSAVCRNMADEFGEVVVVPELATALLNGGFPSVPDMLPWSDEWQEELQDTIYTTQLGFEKAYRRYAEHVGARVAFVDRGLGDGIAFRKETDIGEAKQAFCREHNTTMAEIYGRYDVMIHLQTTAISQPDRFGKAGNAARFDSSNEADDKKRHAAAIERAITQDNRLWEVWKDHPWPMFLPAGIGVLGKISACMGAVRLLLAMKD
jgi:hypothetical protein